MSTSIVDTFRSNHEEMDALHQNFAGNDDAQRATTVNKLRGDMTAACQLQEANIKSTIAGESNVGLLATAQILCHIPSG